MEAVANALLRARVALLLTLLALAGSVAALVRDVAPSSVGAVLAVFSVLLLVAQTALRGYVAQLDQQEIIREARNAADTLEEVRHNTQQELLAEERQNQSLELLLRSMRDLNLLEVKSLESLRDARPTTSYYVQRHARAMLDVLDGDWDRSEFLRPEQLWMEYADLVTKLKRDELFRSTVFVPGKTELLLGDSTFRRYVEAIYDAARSGRVQVKRLFVLEHPHWPIRRDALPPNLIEHLRAVQAVEQVAPALTARVTNKELAERRFHSHPDFMVWGDGLLIESNLNGSDGLVITARFYFAGGHDREIHRRQDQFDELFDDPQQTVGLEELLGPPPAPTR